MAIDVGRLDESHEISQQMIPEEKPELNYCPKCGCSRFQSIDQGRSYRCGDCRFHYFVNNAAAVACLILNDKGELLLTRRAFEPNIGMLDLPGGFVEPQESAEEAVAREIKEELNIKLAKITYLVSFPNLYPFSGFTVPTLDMAFVCEPENLKDLAAGDDVASVEFIDPYRLNFNELCSSSMQKIIRYFLDKC